MKGLWVGRIAGTLPHSRALYAHPPNRQLAKTGSEAPKVGPRASRRNENDKRRKICDTRDHPH